MIIRSDPDTTTFWSDRYHATAIESGEHLIRCLVYIDLNMVRAGVVSHPAEWPHCGYHEIQSPPDRYRIIDRNRLANLCGIRGEEYLRELHLGWTGGELKREPVRQSKWTDSIAVGSENYIELVKEKLGLAASKKQISNDGKTVVIREPGSAYNVHFNVEMSPLSMENSVFFDESLTISI